MEKVKKPFGNSFRATLTLFGMGGQGGGGLSTSFSPVSSTNVEFSSQNFLTFNLNPFAILV